VVGQHRDGLEVLALDREVLDEVLADVLHPLGLGVGQRASGDDPVDGLVDALLSSKQWRGFERGALDHRDDVDERLVVGGLEGTLQIRLGEALRRLSQRLPQLPQRHGPPLLRA
jgi:hypothetical protein